MAAGNSRHSIAGAISDLLAGTPTHPSAVLLEGEPGIGKTTLLRAAAAEAGALGFTVLSTTGSVAESMPSYAALADLLAPVDDDLLSLLPAPQRNALSQVRRPERGAGPTDQRAVAAAFLSTIRALADRTPVLIVIDDLQWLDPSSTAVLSFAVRRISGPVRVLAAVRSDEVTSARWLTLAWPDAVRTICVPAQTLGAMHAMIQRRHGHSLPRPALTRIHRISGGNPFYALELSRTVDWIADPDATLPPTLAEMVRTRLEGLGADTEAALLIVACATTPTLHLVQRAAPPEIGDVIPLLEHAEDADVLSLAGDRVTFTHPLLAQGVLSSADETRRRTAHGRLAEAVTEPEPRARHLALAATGADPMAVDALDEAATSAHVRGAPDAAAELTELALRLGGDTPERRVQLARYHFDAGDGTRARSLLEALVAERPPGPVRSRAYQLLGMVRMFGDSFREAAEVLQDALDQGVEDESLAVMMRVTLALAQYNTGRVHIAIATVSEAIAAAEGIGDPVLLSQALAMRATVGFMAGEGFDEMIMRRALELEGDPDAIHVAFRPTLHNAFLVAWTGRNPHAHNVLREMYQGFLDAGDDAGLNILTFMSVVADIMYGAYAEAAATVETTLERAQQSGSGVALVAAETARAVVTAHTGDEAGTREAVGMAVAATELAETRLITMRAKCQLAFLEVSLGNYEAAWDAVQLSLNALENRPTATEAVIAEFLPDAIEAAVATGRRDVATALVELVEANGRRVDRPWMLMVAARGRALIAAANGDVSAAIAAAQQAMVEHDRLPMPFERARTQLLLGQLLRRRRSKDRATTVLTEALGTFDALGSRLWADRARAELARTASGRAQQALTAQEARVARLAAGGLTNREIAAALFISQKTVEATLARTYRKLGVRTRTELRVNLPPDSED